MIVNVLNLVVTHQFPIPSTNKQVIARLRLHIHCEFNSFCSIESRRRVVQANPLRSRIEIQGIAAHPQSISTVEAQNGDGGVGVNHLDLPSDVVKCVAGVEIHRVASLNDVINIDLLPQRIQTDFLVHPFIPVFDENRVHDGNNVHNQ